MADYTPERIATPGIDIVHGAIQSDYRGISNSSGAAIAKRLAPHGGNKVSCFHHEVLLPSSAPDLIRDVAALNNLYESQLIPAQVDLLGITTVRFDRDLANHRQWELARGWARHAFVGKRSLATILVHHIPGLAGRRHKPHVHLLYPIRELHGGTFSAFSELAKPGAKLALAEEWAAWIGEHL